MKVHARERAEAQGDSGRPLLLGKDLPDPACRDTGWVSSWSRWTDDRWYFQDPARPGHHFSAAVWDFEMHDGSSFLDQAYEGLREATKIVTYCLHRFPAMRAPAKAATMNEVAIGMRYFIRWMVSCGISSLHLVDARVLAAFEDYIVDDKLNDDLDETLSSSSIARYVRAPFAYWEERTRLSSAGYVSLPELPFPNETPGTMGRRLSKVALGRIAPIPKEIFIPLVNRAEWFMEGPAADVVAFAGFLSRELPAVMRETSDRGQRAQLGRYLTRKIEIASFDGKPWHGSLAEEVERVGMKTLTVKRVDGVELARDLVHDVMGAATILLQAAAGLRVSEIEMLEFGGVDPATGVPDCVQVRTDDTGTIELFYLKGYLVKTTKSREPAEWLVGARIVGSTHLPPPILALTRVAALARLVDSGAKSGRLFLGQKQAGAWAYLTGQSVPMDGKQIQNLQRAFAANYVDRKLLDEAHLLRTHGWRKSFAQFVFGVDPTLGPALSQHFKHLSMAMTMEAYVTNDAALLGYLDAERAMETARDLYEISTGRQAPAGRLGASLVKHREQFAKLVRGKTREDAETALFGFVSENQVPFWFLEWGACGVTMAPAEAACHAEAGTSSWRNVAPNFGYRDLEVCAGCSRLLVLRRHLPFWEARYTRLRAAWDEVDEDIGSVFKAALLKKLSQAKAVVRALSTGLVTPPAGQDIAA